MTSLPGFVLSRDCRPRRQLFCDIGWNWNPDVYLRLTVNLRLAAVRRLEYEAADTGLLSPEQAAVIQRVKGAKRIGVKIGNWLSAEQARALVKAPDVETMRGKRDHAIISILVGCGVHRSEVAGLTLDNLQQRDAKRAVYSRHSLPRSHADDRQLHWRS